MKCQNYLLILIHEFMCKLILTQSPLLSTRWNTVCLYWVWMWTVDPDGLHLGFSDHVKPAELFHYVKPSVNLSSGTLPHKWKLSNIVPVF